MYIFIHDAKVQINAYKAYNFLPFFAYILNVHLYY